MIAYILGSALLITLAWYAARDTAIRDAIDRHPAGSLLRECEGCGAESGEECHWHCLSWVT